MKFNYFIVYCDTAQAFGTNDRELAEQFMNNSDYCVINVLANQYTDGDGPGLPQEIKEMNPD